MTGHLRRVIFVAVGVRKFRASSLIACLRGNCQELQMSLMSSLRTGVSGMNAQSNRINSVAENIANSSTTGYKRSAIEFESVLGTTTGVYSSGSVAASARNQISQQGVLNATSSATDLGIDGNGFFVVSDSNGEQLLSRAGAFLVDPSGRLVDVGGHVLMGFDLASGASGILAPVTLPQETLISSPSTAARFSANLPAEANIVDSAALPSLNNSGSSWSSKSSIVAFDNLGKPVTLDLYFAKVSDSEWEVSIFDRVESTAGGFPYGSGPLSTNTIEFDSLGSKTSPDSLSVGVPNGAAVRVDLSGMKQLSSAFSVFESSIDGNAPARPNRLEVGRDGVVTTVFDNGTRQQSFRIPLASVASPDRLVKTSGSAFSVTSESGGIRLGSANQHGAGAIISGALEGSTVDVADELTTMIEAQRNFTANSRVFQTSSELFEVLNRL